MAHGSDVRVRNVTLYYLPIKTRLPLKFGPETTTHTTCARALVRVEGRSGVIAEGWGETPLSVAWVWPSTLGYETRLAAMQEFTAIVGTAWAECGEWGHPLEIGHLFVQERLPALHQELQRRARRGRRTADALARGARLRVAVRHRDPRRVRGAALACPVTRPTTRDT